MIEEAGRISRLTEGDARPTAVVAAVQLAGVTDGELASSIAELERLATTLGLEVIGRVTQRRAKLAPGIVLGEGKLVELARWTGGTGVVPTYQKPGSHRDDPDPLDETAARSDESPERKATIVIVDHELSPTQSHNLELATGVEVVDRTSVILEIFHRHAKTREARLQVEVARLKYLAPRLRGASGGGDRVRGGIGGKGAGESALELDRRRIRDRIAELKDELGRIEGGSKIRRDRRSALPTVALVGYTNAGKSSLMRALTSTDVYVADKLFATLDTTVRRLVPPTEPPVLVSDTVGFIKKLPHDLVASFRSTLDEAGDADLLLHVVDASDPAHADQLAVTRGVLAEIGADASPSWLLLNKIDRVSADDRVALSDHYPDAIQLSAKSPADIAVLRDRLIEHFSGSIEEAELVVPWDRQKLVNAIHERTTVLAEDHDEAGTRLRIRAPASVIADLTADLSA
ncbi:MAG TPA: GTPase HflX [Kofleriaceae bacterium]|jgi:GTP-binding protein HflX|nr:GTPase HflX [Kofleriaceae bacterium]